MNHAAKLFIVLVTLSTIFVLTFNSSFLQYVIPMNLPKLNIDAESALEKRLTSGKDNSALLSCEESFHFNRSEWTVTLRMPWNALADYCITLLKQLKNDGKVKLIIHQNGTEENLGCTAFTSKCNESAHYDDKYKTRVNTPPCCRKKLLEIFSRITDELDRNNITNMLVYGGLLGYVRNNAKMIPYDNDLDIIIDHEVWNMTLLHDILNNLNKGYGHVYEYRDNGKKITIRYSSVNNLGLDMWPFSVEGWYPSRIAILHYHFNPPALRYVFPLRHVVFEGIWTHIPRDAAAFLDLQYGKDEWKKELSCKYIDGAKCVKHAQKKNFNVFLMLIILSGAAVILNNRNVIIQYLPLWKKPMYI